MLVNKITTGFVIQLFDTKTKQYVSQSFTAAAEVNYENSQGDTLSETEMAESNFGPYTENEPYLPFDMVQPGFLAYRQGVIDTADDVKLAIEEGMSLNDAIHQAVEGFDDDLREIVP